MPNQEDTEPEFGSDLSDTPTFCTHCAALITMRASTMQGRAFEFLSGRGLSVGKGKRTESPGAQERSIERRIWR